MRNCVLERYILQRGAIERAYLEGEDVFRLASSTRPVLLGMSRFERNAALFASIRFMKTAVLT